MELFQRDRHEALPPTHWNETGVRIAIREIADTALAHFDREELWPSHKLDGVPDGIAGLYMGAAGNILALEHLKRAGAIEYTRDFSPELPAIVERDNLWLKNTPFKDCGSLLMGDVGTRLASMRLAPNAKTANALFERAEGNNAQPLLDLMWGTAGSMLACLFMQKLTEEKRFAQLFQAQAERLLAGLEDAGPAKAWVLEMRGRRFRYLGLVHGFAGNILPLFLGWNSLSEDERKTIENVIANMLTAWTLREDGGANWPADADQPAQPLLCQICHGAPGIVTAFAGAPFSTPELERALAEGGELVWRAGPLKKGSNFCHGTGGNAYALVKLYKRTRDTKWLARARSLAAAAIMQMRAARMEYGAGRYTLWTGDLGLAVCLWSCITGEPGFPALDMI